MEYARKMRQRIEQDPAYAQELLDELDLYNEDGTFKGDFAISRFCAGEG